MCNGHSDVYVFALISNNYFNLLYFYLINNLYQLIITFKFDLYK